MVWLMGHPIFVALILNTKEMGGAVKERAPKKDIGAAGIHFIPSENFTAEPQIMINKRKKSLHILIQSRNHVSFHF